jgi:hypothetical protein
MKIGPQIYLEKPGSTRPHLNILILSFRLLLDLQGSKRRSEDNIKMYLRK